MDYLFFAIGIAIGFVVAFLFTRAANARDIAAADQHRQSLETQITELKQDRERIAAEQTSALQALRQQTETLIAERAELKTTADFLNNQLRDQREETELTNKRFAAEFENLANRILEEKSKTFTEQNKVNIDAVLTPLKERIQLFEQKVERTYTEDTKERSSLSEQIRSLLEMNIKLSDEANNLATALKGDKKSQGTWGEIQLERLLEVSGLIKDQEYRLQVSSTNSEGDKIIPDAVILLPEEKHLIVDSKVSLNAYTLFVQANTDDERDVHLKQHTTALRNHIKSLSEKNYHTGFASPEIVLMFMPIEPAFAAAMQADHELFSFAWDKRIVIVSPSTLLATLRTVASIWKHERQSQNAVEIANEAGRMYDKLDGALQDLMKVGKGIDDSKKMYEEGMKKLFTGSGNLIRKAEHMKELGAKATKSISQAYIDRAMEDE